MRLYIETSDWHSSSGNNKKEYINRVKDVKMDFERGQINIEHSFVLTKIPMKEVIKIHLYDD